MRRFLAACAAVLSLASLPAAAAPPAKPKDPAEAAAVAQVERFFAAMKAGDEATLKTILLPDVTFSAQRLKDGQASLRRIPAADWAASLAKGGGPVVDERMWNPTVLRRGPIATVWAPYELLVDGKQVHCGVDVFDLVQVDGTWRVAHLMWTQEPTACAELKGRG